MATTIPYSQFIGSRDPYPVLKSTAARISELCRDLSGEQMATPPEPGKWSIHEIVAHLADTELMFQVRIRLILFEDSPHLTAYNQDQWVNGWTREQEPFEATLERFRVLRESTVRLLENTPEHDLKRTGTHAERGIQTAGDYIIIAAGHDINHLDQITSIRARMS
jgi:uncharacterized damage-inducible protein DinB